MSSSAFGVAVMNWLLGVVAFLRLNIFGEWILKETVRDWELPKYEEMVKDK
jgi:hypothetical protein